MKSWEGRLLEPPNSSAFVFKKNGTVTLSSHGHFEENDKLYVNSTETKESRVRARSSLIQCSPELRRRNGDAPGWEGDSLPSVTL